MTTPLMEPLLASLATLGIDLATDTPEGRARVAALIRVVGTYAFENWTDGTGSTLAMMDEDVEEWLAAVAR